MSKLPVLDETDRERVRAALHRYMEIHKCGVPELYQRMSAALGISVFEQSSFAQSTLQRFLKGTIKRKQPDGTYTVKPVRTEDRAVMRYRRFLEQVAPPPPEEKFVESLSEFLLAVHLKEESLERLIGTYRVWNTISDSEEDSGFLRAPYSILTLERGQDDSYLLVTEDVCNPERNPKHASNLFNKGTRPENDYAPYSVRAGVLLCQGGYEISEFSRYVIITRGYEGMSFYQLSRNVPESDPAWDLKGHTLEPANPYWSSHYANPEHYEVELINLENEPEVPLPPVDPNVIIN